MLRELLHTVMVDYTGATQAKFAQHPLASLIRRDGERVVSEILGEDQVDLRVQGSAGAGNWASVPWISVFDLSVTDSATEGYYLVYLFHAAERIVHLSLNQGTTAVRAEHKGATREVLRDRAEAIRKRIPEFARRFTAHSIELGSKQTLPADYEAAHAMGKTYRIESLPDEQTLVDDLQQLVAAYRALTFRGGLEPSLAGDSISANGPASLLELRQYTLHRRIERNRSASKIVKKVHGVRCQCCDLNFAEKYGDLGQGFIEVHHLKPLSSLNEGTRVRYDVATDFAVLCANCHRMIHRLDDPSDLQELRFRRSAQGQ